MKSIMVKLKHFLYDQFRMLCYSFLSSELNACLNRKSRLAIYFELIRWYIHYHERNRYYEGWQLYRKEISITDYIGRNEFLALKNRAECRLKKVSNTFGMNYDVLTKDKFIAGSFLYANKIPSTKTIGLLKQGQYQSMDHNQDNLESLIMEEQELVIKSLALEAGEGVLHWCYHGDSLLLNGKISSWCELMSHVAKGIWLVQSVVVNHARILDINNSALNTTRIVTIREKQGLSYLSGFQAFATGGAKTDSWSSGSLYVGIDTQSGCLKDKGYYNLEDKPQSYTYTHPDSGIYFKDYPLPYLKEAVDLCIEAHKLFYNNFIIGWDVAITDNGPIIVEANEKPGMNVVQCVDGGLRKRILSAYHDLLEFDKDVL